MIYENISKLLNLLIKRSELNVSISIIIYINIHVKYLNYKYVINSKSDRSSSLLISASLFLQKKK